METEEIQRELENQGFVSFNNQRYEQTSGNCFEIASFIARKLGFKFPRSRKELIDLIFELRAEELWGQKRRIIEESRAYLVIRTPDNPTDVHVTFEYLGREFNYGPGDKDDVTLDKKIPLHKVGGNHDHNLNISGK